MNLNITATLTPDAQELLKTYTTFKQRMEFRPDPSFWQVLETLANGKQPTINANTLIKIATLTSLCYIEIQ